MFSFTRTEAEFRSPARALTLTNTGQSVSLIRVGKARSLSHTHTFMLLHKSPGTPVCRPLSCAHTPPPLGRPEHRQSGDAAAPPLGLAPRSPAVPTSPRDLPEGPPQGTSPRLAEPAAPSTPAPSQPAAPRAGRRRQEMPGSVCHLPRRLVDSQGRRLRGRSPERDGLALRPPGAPPTAQP